jgi:3D (Asp-Asp-Asp) domain-containing protein
MIDFCKRQTSTKEGQIKITLLFSILFICAAVVGMTFAQPYAVYATGERVTDPWVVNVDGVPVAVVDSKAAGESVETGLRMHYAGSDFEAQQEIEMVNEITVTKYDFEDANTHPVVMNGADAVSYIIGLNETSESPVVGFKTTRYTSAEEEIPFDTVEMEDDGFALGETQVTQEGENGAMETTYFETLLNGKVISSVAVDQTVTKEPVDKVVVTGTKEPEPEPEPEEEPAQTSSSSGSGSSYTPTSASTDGMEYLGTYTISAYNFAEGHYATASGAYPTPYRTVAMNGLPFGTELYIEGVGYVVVQDRGGLPADWIDLHIGNDSCSSWGMPRCKVYIVH